MAVLEENAVIRAQNHAVTIAVLSLHIVAVDPATIPVRVGQHIVRMRGVPSVKMEQLSYDDNPIPR